MSLALATAIHTTNPQATAAIPPSLVTPDKVETRIGTLDFKEGAPSKAAADKVYDNLDFTYAYRAFMDNLRGVSIQAVRKGLQSIGVKDNEVLVFEQLMDAKSLFLTANADTIYVMGSLVLSKGPVVLETPSRFLGAMQDAWFRWLIDLGAPGPDRGEAVLADGGVHAAAVQREGPLADAHQGAGFGKLVDDGGGPVVAPAPVPGDDAGVGVAAVDAGFDRRVDLGDDVGGAAGAAAGAGAGGEVGVAVGQVLRRGDGEDAAEMGDL